MTSLSRVCTLCRLDKPVTAFRLQTGKNRPRSHCRECERKAKKVKATDKQCVKCKERKPIEQFHLAMGNRDQRKNVCKVCSSVIRGSRASPKDLVFQAMDPAIQWLYGSPAAMRRAAQERLAVSPSVRVCGWSEIPLEESSL